MSKSDRYDAPRVLCPVHGKDCTFDCLKCVGCRDDGVWEFQCTTCFDILPYTANDWKKNRYAFKHARGDCVKVADDNSSAPAPHPPPLAVCWQPNWKPRKTKTQEPTAPSPSPATVTYHQCNPSDVVTLFGPDRRSTRHFEHEHPGGQARQSPGTAQRPSASARDVENVRGSFQVAAQCFD